jgi:hypothetical protein
MRKLGIALYTIFALLFAGLPFFVLKMSSLSAAKYEGFVLQPWLWAALGAVALCLVPIELPKIPDWLAAPLWGCAAFQYRYHCFHQIETRMVMKYDFATVLESVRGVKQAKEAIFTHWAFYPRVLEWWNGLCSQQYLYRNAVYFNLLTGAATVLLVYLIARRVWKRQRAAMIAAAIACFWPSLSYYASVTSNEHLAMLGILLTSYLGILAWQLNEDTGTVLSSSFRRFLVIILVILAGICAGLTDLFKQFSPVFLIASFGTGLLFLLIGHKKLSGETRSETAKRKRGLGKQILCLILAVAVMFGASYAVKEKAYRWLEGYLEMPVARNATAHFLWIGLNSKGNGVWTEEEGMKVYELAEQYDNDYGKAMDELMQMLKEDLRAHPKQIKDTLRAKMEKDWEADIGVTLWAKSLYDEVAIWEEQHPGEVFHDWEVTREELDAIDFDPGDGIAMSSAAYYMCVMGLIALGGLLAIFLRNPAETYLRLVFYGYALLLLLSEAQGRYQVVLFPVFALLAAGAAEVAGTAPWMLRKKPSEKGEKINGT